MLKLEKIKKIYKTADLHVEALKGISIEFRQHEFVSILGPSGCGKTTLLNIVGGLDKYNSGDLVINGKSTKTYTDKDWDSYRNHSVGFVFQSYNLIPHQTVLENVELALTLSGIGKEERKKRATAVLKKVGLGDRLKNKPNQLSGGQMQRVAIARALVNDPDIILADEPTGALDTVTSVQIMELLKEISKDKLIIMVTHNPELAQLYSTRIVKLLDGKMIDDSNPYKSALEVVKPNEDELKRGRKPKQTPKTRMSIFTAFMLSLKNLLTKKARTLLVSIAGAIGIIGIALILAISNGFNNYVNSMQEQSLANYPITIQNKSIDIQSALTSMFMPSNNDESVAHEKDDIYPKDRILGLLNSVGSSSSVNNLTPFYKYLNQNKAQLKDDLTAIKYSYDLGLEFYKNDDTLNANSSVSTNSSVMYKMVIMYSLNYFSYIAGVTIDVNGTQYVIRPIEGQTRYEFVSGFISPDASETLQTEGSLTLNGQQVEEIINNILQGSVNIASYSATNIGAFSEMLANDDLINENYQLVYGNKIQNPNEVYLVLDKNNELDDSIFYALGLISDEDMNTYIDNMIRGKKQTFKLKYEDVVGTQFKVLAKSDYVANSSNTSDEVIYKNYYDASRLSDEDRIKRIEVVSNAFENCENVLKVVGVLRLKEGSGTSVLNVGINYSSLFADSMMDYHNDKAELVGNIEVLKSIDKELPDAISLYAVSFEGKNRIKDFIEKYNANTLKENQISYSDLAGSLMNSLSTIISSITYVLIAFVSVSLVVSSIMIGIITYISVIERTKEIGVLRSIGASKRDIKHVFTAESGIIGLLSGVLGILVAFLLLIPINLILSTLAGISGLAQLPILPSIILILISVVLTLIAGVVPARVAAKRDPVIALRSE